jgi:uncharacterized membrane protein (DUF485 family)
MSAAMHTDTPEEMAARRRRVRNTALRLALFALVVYVGFIVAFINRHS